MEGNSATASSIIAFAEKVESASAAFYEGLAAAFSEHSEQFQAFARDSAKNKVFVVRTYQETISDALEACFSFEGLNLQDYKLPELSERGATRSQALAQAIALEEHAVEFYLDVASRCESLLGTIPRAFRRVAQTRCKRKEALQALQS